MVVELFFSIELCRITAGWTPIKTVDFKAIMKKTKLIYSLQLRVNISTHKCQHYLTQNNLMVDTASDISDCPETVEVHKNSPF